MTSTSAWLRSAIALSEEILDRGSSEDKIIEAVIRFHLTLGIRDAKAIEVLTAAGVSDAAHQHVRRLWEGGIRVLYILQEPDSRSRAFVEEAWVEDYRTFQSAERFA
ncbi:MAG: hypothetical protein ACYCOU_06140, partial [Sulfobacillus sp.]